MHGLTKLADQLKRGGVSVTSMNRGGLYTPAWQSPTDGDRKLNELQTGNEAGTLLPRRDGKVVPVCVHIEDNGLCTDDDDDDEEDREKENLVAATDNHVGEARSLAEDLDSAERGGVNRLGSPSSSSSSISGDLRGYNDSNLKTSVYDLPPELDGSPSSSVRRARSGSTAEQRPSLVESLASDALSAVVRSCRSVQSPARNDDVDDVDRLSTVSSPAVFVVSDTKQLVIFSVDRAPRRATFSPAACVPPLSHSDQTLNRCAIDRYTNRQLMREFSLFSRIEDMKNTKLR